MDMDRIYALALEFRNLLQAALDGGLETKCHIDEHFPRACCEDASVLLANFLAENGFPGALLVYGEHGGLREELRTHVWLRLNDLQIDITGDQFQVHGYDQPPVHVATSCSFLETFLPARDVHPADFRTKYAEKDDWLYWFESTYSKIVKNRSAKGACLSTSGA